MSLTSFAVRRPVTTVAATLGDHPPRQRLGHEAPGLAAAGRRAAGAHHPHDVPGRGGHRGLALRRRADREGDRGDAGASSSCGRSAATTKSTTTVHFAWGTDMEKTVLNVRERLDNARGTPAADAPAGRRCSPAIRASARSPCSRITSNGDLSDLSHLAEDVHSRRLEQLEGVASVAVVGARTTRSRFASTRSACARLGLTPDDISTAIRRPTPPAAAARSGADSSASRSARSPSSRHADEILDTPIGRPRGMVPAARRGEVAVTTAPPLDGHAARRQAGDRSRRLQGRRRPTRSPSPTA